VCSSGSTALYSMAATPSASVKTGAGLEELNSVLTNRSYLGSEASATEEDFAVLASLPSCIDKTQYPQVHLWSRHLRALKAQFPFREWPCGTKYTSAGSGASAPQAAGVASKSTAPAKASPKAEVASKEDKKKEAPKPAASPAGAARDEDDDAAAKISLIVGKVTKVWDHPDSDKLFCEEIDCGEATVRQIGSGLRHFYKTEDFLGRMVLVVANLKPKKLAGFESNGMVLCASNMAHTDVKFVEVPAGAKPGDRVVFGDMAMDDPAPPNNCEKKKLFAKAQPHFVSKGGVAMYKDKPFTLPSGVCTAPVEDGYALS